VAADAPITDGSITPVRDINRWPKQSATPSFAKTSAIQILLANQTGWPMALL
jgi:hypothetical protein